MRRRTLLKNVGLVGAVGSSTASGCLDSVVGTGGAAGGEYRWRYDVGGELDAVSRGVVFARERSDGDGRGGGILGSGPEADGQVVALDAGTGELRWTYGETGRLDDYSDLAVADGVYVGRCGDDDCIGLYALDRDGEERWRDDTVGTRHAAPFVADGVVYVASDVGVVSAFDAETGAERWTDRVGESDDRVGGSGIVDVADAVYVETDASLVALDRAEGSTRWRYGPGDGRARILDTTVSNGVAYVVTGGRVAAVADGDELWRRAFEAGEADTETEITGIASGRLFVLAGNDRRESRLYAFDVATGERDRMSDSIEHPDEEYGPFVTVHDDAVYVATDRLRALDAATGRERWSEAVDAGPIQSATVVEEGAKGGHAVVVHYDDGRLAEFDPDGERTWEGSVDGTIRNYLVDESAFVATDEGIYALDR